jgi:pimeloyl-ACP methyl ester carboxylesterase
MIMSKRAVSPTMHRFISTLALAIGALLGAAAWTANAAAPIAPSDPMRAAQPGELVRLPDGRRLNFRCAGKGAPTVIFEGGFAATSLAWFKVQPQVAKRRRACAYDRAGYGFSDPGPSPRDGAAVAKDLDEGLTAAHIKGPFILVGHSAGGLYVRLFSDRRPDQVEGMVLVDPSVDHQDERLEAAFGPGAGSLAGLRARAARCLAAAEQHNLPSSDPTLAACTPKANAPETPAVAAARMAEAVRPSTWRTQISELDTLWGATSDEVYRGRPSLGAMPLIVLTADGTYASVPPQARSAVDRVWRQLHQEVARRSTRGSERLVANTSHMIMLDQPNAVIQAIEEVAAQQNR